MPAPPGTRLAFAALLAAVLSFSLLQTMVVPALPDLRRELNASPAAMSWVLIALLLTSATGTVILSRLGDLYGNKRLMLIILGTGTLLAAVSGSIGILIGARAVQGLGGATFPLAFRSGARHLPPRPRPDRRRNHQCHSASASRVRSSLVPQFVQTPTGAGYGFGTTAAESGLFLPPLALTMLVSGPVAGRLGTRWGLRPTLVIACCIAAAGFALLATGLAAPWAIATGAGVLGVGAEFAFSSIINLVVDAVDVRDTGQATGVNTIVRTVGGAIGAQVAAAILYGFPRARVRAAGEVWVRHRLRRLGHSPCSRRARDSCRLDAAS